MELNTLRDALIHELEDLYSAEQQLLRGLPRLTSAVTSGTLRQSVEQHLTETKSQVQRLDQIFAILGQSPRAKTCQAMQGLMEELEEVIEATGNPQVKDAILIGAAQRMEHYELAGYGTAREFASQLGLDEITELLQETLDEEGAADKRLTSLAEGGFITGGLNARAQQQEPYTGSH